MTQEVNFYQVVQERYNIVEVAQNMLNLELKKVGNRYRAKSPAQSNSDNPALEIIPETNSFHDYSLNISGDITELVARIMYGGDKAQALRCLVPELYSQDRGQLEKQLKEKKEFADKIEFWNKQLNRPDSRFAQLARQYLMDRGFTMQTVNELKIGLMEDYGLSEQRIVFPYWDEQGKNVIYFTTRKFPCYEKYQDGKPVGDPYEHENSPKYKKASLEKFPFLHNAPMGLNTLQRKGLNGDGILVITEGVCDWLAFYQEGYSVVAPNGCGDKSFWDIILKKVGEFRRVLLAFDNDEAGKDFTYKAAKVLMENDIPFECAGFMAGIKDVAEYYKVAGNLTAIVNSAKEGFFWVVESLVRPEPFENLPIYTQKELMKKATEVLTRIAVDLGQYRMHEAMLSLKRYFPKEWVSNFIAGIKDEVKKGQRERKKEEQMRVVDKIIASHRLVYDSKAGFYEYSKTEHRWVHKPDEYIGSYIVRQLGMEATGAALVQIMRLVKTDERIVNDEVVKKFNTLPRFTFLNGTLHIDIKTGEVQLHPSDYTDYNTVCLPYFYDPKAKCRNWVKFIEDITGGNQTSMRILQEFPGYALLPDCRFQRCLLLKGSGANGKSVYTKILSAMFGGFDYDNRGYVSYVEPGRFKYQFSLMPLMYSLINISSDTENDLRFAEGHFKRIIAGEALEDSHKFKDKMAFPTRSKLIMCCNDYPSTNDTTDGFMRRFLLVELPFRFVDDPRPNSRDKKCDYNLEGKLKEELSGIFNWALAGLARLIQQGDFTKPRDEDIKEFKCFNNHLFDFTEEVLYRFFDENGKGREIHRKEIFQEYVKWAIEGCIQPMANHKFYRCLTSVLNSMGITFTVKGSKRNPIWKFDDKPDSIDLKDYAPEEVIEAREAQEDALELVQELADMKEQEREQEQRKQYLQDPEDEDEWGEDFLQAAK